MTVLDGILTGIHWLHHLGAVAWVGGCVFYLLVLRPAWRRLAAGPELRRSVGEEFRGVVHTAIAILVVTGVIMAVAELTREEVSGAYLVALGVKVGLAVYMILLVWLGRRPAARREDDAAESGRWGRIKAGLTGTTALLVLGVLVIGLSDVLAALG